MGDTKTDALALRDLLLWARKNGFRLGPAVELGSIKAQVTDLRLGKREALMAGTDDDDDDAPDIVAEHGGPREKPAEGTV